MSSAFVRSLTLVTSCLLAWNTVAAQEADPPPTHGEQVLIQALDQLEAGQIEPALVLLEAIRKTGEAPPQALAVLGALYLETDRAPEALVVLEPLAAAADADPAVLYNAGRAAAATGDPRRAVDYLWRSVQREPASPARRELGLLLGRLEQHQEAYASLRPWALAYPGDHEARRAAAVLAVELDRPLEAEELLAGLSEDDPGVRLLWAQTLLRKSDPLGAIGYLKPLLNQTNGKTPAALDDDVRRTAAAAYVLIGEAGRAVELLREHADNPGTALQLSSAHFQSGDLEQALATLEPFAPNLAGAQARAPWTALDQELILEYGRLLSTAARHQEAIPYLRLATQLQPERAPAWQALGQALAAAGQRAEAQAALQRFAQLNQAKTDETTTINQQEADLRDPTGRELRAIWDLALQPGKAEQALEKLNLQAEIAPDDPRPPLLASRLLVFQKRFDEALVAAERALAVSVDHPDALYQKGVVLMAMDRLPEAEAALRRALERNPQHIAAMSDLAILLANSQRPDEARGLLRRILELRPDDPAAQQHLDRLDQHQGG